MRHQFSIAMSILLLAGAPALAQQGSRFNDRLMFDPNSFSGARQLDAPKQASPTATTGQSAPPPATRQAVAPPAAAQPQPQATPQAKPQGKPKPAARTAAAPRRAAPAERRIGDATSGVTTNTAAGRPVPREETNLGRLAIPQGSLGYESRTQMQTYDMSDGRRVPGYDNIQRNDSSYFGLSLRMPTAPSSGSSPFALGNHGAN
jgi:hypothetical protein